MTQRSALALTSSLLIAIVAAAACGAEDKSPDDGSGAITTGTMTVPPGGTASVPPGATTTPPGATTTPPGATTTPPGATTTPPGATTSPVASMMPPMLSECTNVAYDTQNNENDVSLFSGVQSVYFFGDSTTSMCATPTANKVCVEGNAVSSKGATDDYQFWGAGVGLQLAATAEPPIPFDASAQAITQVRFGLSGVSGRPVRVQISQVDDPAITDAALNYQNNAFGWGGSSPTSTTTDKVVTISLDAFKLPSWTKIVDAAGAVASGQVLDPTKIHSLQIQIANNPPDTAEPYSYCIENLEWLDAAGTVVMVTKVDPPAMASTTAPTGSETAPTTSASASTGGEGGGGGTVDPGTGGAGGTGGGGGDADPFDAAWEVMKVSCAGAMCHDEGPAAGDHPYLASTTRETALMAATMFKAAIGDRVTRTGLGKMPPMGTLSADDLAAIQAFVDAP